MCVLFSLRISELVLKYKILQPEHDRRDCAMDLDPLISEWVSLNFVVDNKKSFCQSNSVERPGSGSLR